MTESPYSGGSSSRAGEIQKPGEVNLLTPGSRVNPYGIWAIDYHDIHKSKEPLVTAAPYSIVNFIPYIKEQGSRPIPF
jgi:hypothetical protein